MLRPVRWIEREPTSSGVARWFSDRAQHVLPLLIVGMLFVTLQGLNLPNQTILAVTGGALVAYLVVAGLRRRRAGTADVLIPLNPPRQEQLKDAAPPVTAVRQTTRPTSTTQMPLADVLGRLKQRAEQDPLADAALRQLERWLAASPQSHELIDPKSVFFERHIAQGLEHS